MANNNKIKIISYNVASGNHLAGLSQLISIYDPTFIFLQEVTVNTAQLRTLIGSRYEAECNLDLLDLKRPGTAIAWLKGIDVAIINYKLLFENLF